MLTDQAAIAANRFGLGARPGDGKLIGADPKGWLAAQLGAADAPAPPAASGLGARAGRGARAARRAPSGRASARQRHSPTGRTGARVPGIAEQAIREFGEFVREHYLAQTAERHRLAIESDRPFVERLVHFWANHFAVSADKQPLGAIAGLYEQEAIRPHVTGNFLDLLLAAERHPAMILYLDNQASMGPASTAASFVRRNRGRELGLNENLAREILELHTLGVDGGYDQHDVTEFAKVLTGWSIGGQLGGAAAARSRGSAATRVSLVSFTFVRSCRPGTKTILGKQYRERGEEEGEEVLRTLARHPATARHLATKLARHFVADDPPAALVEHLAKVYLQTDGELTSVYRALIATEEGWREPLAKFKTPHDFVISAYRLLGHVPANCEPITGFLTQVGNGRIRPARRRLARHGCGLERRRRVVEAHRVRHGRGPCRGRPARSATLADEGWPSSASTPCSAFAAPRAPRKGSRCCCPRPSFKGDSDDDSPLIHSDWRQAHAAHTVRTHRNRRE
jgi:uncharacterized protein (DUF1800 family)